MGQLLKRKYTINFEYIQVEPVLIPFVQTSYTRTKVKVWTYRLPWRTPTAQIEEMVVRYPCHLR